MTAVRVTPVEGGVRFAIHVQPRSSKPGVGGTHGEALKVRVGAAPVDGAANEAVAAALAKAFDIPRRNVEIVSGASSRSKVVELTGVSAQAVATLGASSP